MKLLATLTLGIVVGCLPAQSLESGWQSIQTEVIMVPTSTTIPYEETDYAKWVRSKPMGECPVDRNCHNNHYYPPTLEELVEEYFRAEDIRWALRVAFCESSAQPEDISSDKVHRTSGATGWFQHLPKFWEDRSYKAGFSGWYPAEPRANVGVAAWILYNLHGGKSHWYPSRNCWEE